MSDKKIENEGAMLSDTLREVLDVLDDGIIVYDPGGEVLFCNQTYRHCYPEVASLLTPGSSLENILHETVALKDIPEAKDDPKTWVRQKLEARLNPETTETEHYIAGRWWRLREGKTFDGAVFSKRRDITAEKNAEISLVAATNSLAGQVSPDAFAIYDEDGNLTDMTPGYEACYPDLADVLKPGANLADILRVAAEHGGIADTTEDIDKWVREKFNQRLNPTGEIEEKLINGRWWRLAEHKMSDGGVISVRTDITLAREAQNNAIGAQALLGDVVDGFRDGFALYDNRDRLIVCNTRYHQLTRVPLDSLKPGAVLGDIIEIACAALCTDQSSHNAEDLARAWMGKVRKSGGALEHRTGDGMWLAFFQRKTAQGYSICQLQDVTEIRNRENALRISEERATAAQRRLVTAIESMSEGFFIFDKESRLVLCNSNYKSLVGGPAKDIKPGASFKTIVRMFAKNAFPDITPEEREGWVNMREREHRISDGIGELNLPDGRTIRTADFHTENGDFVGLRTDITSIKKAEKMLQVAEQRYRHLIELTPDIICIVNNGVISLINTPGARMLGAKEPGILIGQSFVNFVHNDFRDLITEEMKELLAEKSWSEVKLIKIGGAVMDAELAVMTFDSDEPGSVMIVARDTTERHRAAEALLAREGRLRGIMNTVVDGIVTIDETGIIDSFNPAAEKIFGYPASDVIGENIHILMPEPYKSAHDGYITHYKRTGDPKIIGKGREVLGQRRDGSLFPLDLAVSEMRHEGRSTFIGVIRDITEQKRSEAVLRESEERYALAAQGTNDGIWDWDIPGDKLYISPRMQEMIGQESRSWVRSSFLFEFAHPDDREMAMDALIKHMKGETEYVICEVRNSASGDALKWYRIRGAALRDETGRAYRIAGSLSNITEQKEHDEVLRVSVERAEIANRAKTDFLANMSHELRTPLNAIIGFSEIMDHKIYGSVGDSRYEEYIKNIGQSGRHLLDIINDILDVARIEEGMLELHPERVKVLPVLNACIGLIEERANRAKVKIVSRVGKSIPDLRSEPRRLKQILLNLISNAVKFTPGGGQVAISVREIKTGGIVLSVTDTGIGMSAKEIETAMTPFGQVDSRLARAYEGTGLGLPLTEGFVKLHGGTMQIKSKLGEGTRVTVRFPPESVIR